MRRLIPIAIAIALAAPAAANAASLPADTTAVISGTANLLGLLPTPVADSSSGRQSVSGDGSRVAFVSRADGLLPGDDDDVTNVYVSDTITGTITLVSRSDGANGEPSHSDCYQPVISDDGRRVAFTCDGALDPADNNDRADVYLRDLLSGRTVWISRATNGAPGNGRSSEPSIDATGTYVAFTTNTTNLYPGTAGSSVLRSAVGAANPFAFVTGDGEHPSISNDGTRVAFQSDSVQDGGDTNEETDVYLRDLTAATTTLVSRADGNSGKVGNDDSLEPEISGDGKFVAFTSNATNFDPTDTNPEADVYRRSLTSGATQLVSVTIGGAKGNAPSLLGGIDDSGARVSFVSASTNLVDDSPPAGGVYAYVNTPQGIVLASRRNGYAGAPLRQVEKAAISGNGIAVAFTSGGGANDDVDPRTASAVLRRLDVDVTLTVSRPQGGAPFLNEGGYGDHASVSADGRYVAFDSSAPAFGLPAGVSRGIVVRDTLTGATSLVSRQDGPNGGPLGNEAYVPSISADGRRVAFAVSSPDGLDKIYVRDIPTSRTYRIDRADGANGAPANAASFNPAISGDGNRVAFTTGATNLAGGDTDDQSDVYVRDIAAGRTLLASRADGEAGAKANGRSDDASLSEDGSRVAFASRATNLGDGDTDDRSDVHVRDLAAGRTLLASSARGFPKGDDAYLPSISDDGKLVSFASRASYGTGTSTDTKLYLRDLAAGTVSFAKVGGAPFSGDIYYAALSGDGSSIAFSARTDTSIDGASTSAGLSRVYVSDFAAGTTRLVSRRSGANGASLAKEVSTFGGISADGSCVAFSTPSRVLAPPASVDFDNVYMRVFKADCGGRTVGAGVLSGDTQAPRLSNAKLTRKRFRVSPKATALTARRVPRGTVLSLRVSEAARLSVTVDRKRVVRRGKKKRTRYTRDGVLVRNLKSGAVRISFSGRLARKRLAVGVHRLTLVARDAAGNKSKPVTLRFTVVK